MRRGRLYPKHMFFQCMLEMSVVHVLPQMWWRGVPHPRAGSRKTSVAEAVVCAWNNTFSQTQIEAEGDQYRQRADCRKLGRTVSVQPTTGEPGTRAWTLSFDEQEASTTSVGLECVVRLAV